MYAVAGSRGNTCVGFEAAARKNKILLKKRHLPAALSAHAAPLVAEKVKHSKMHAPALHIGFDAQGKPLIALARQAPPIRHLVFQGGGAKGVVYPSFIQEMERQQPGFIASLDDVAGTSAGAAMAFLLAAGVSLEEMEQFALHKNLLSQMTGRSGPIHLGHDGLFSAMKLRHTLHALSIKPAAAYYRQHIANDRAKQLFVRAQYGGDAFLKRAQNGFSSGLTFNDLKILHSLQPSQFKLLHVTAYDKKAAKTFYFDGNNPKTRHVRCFEAVGASMAIPLVFRSVKLQLDGESRPRRFVDGGVGSNAPVEIFPKSSAETLLLHFESDGLARRILHDKALPVRECRWQALKQLARRVLGVFKVCLKKDPAVKWYGLPPLKAYAWVAGKTHIENVRQDRIKIHNQALNAAAVPHGNLNTLSFMASIERKQKAIESAKKAAGCYMQAVHPTDGAVQRSYTTVEAAVRSLSPSEIQRLKGLAAERIAQSEKMLQSLIAENLSPARISRQIMRNQLERQFYTALKNN